MHVGPGLDQQPYHGFVLRVMIVTQFIHGMVQRCELMPFKKNKETGNRNTETQKHTGNGKTMSQQFCTIDPHNMAHYRLSCSSNFAPLSRSNLTTFTCPPNAAAIKGVRPLRATLLTSAPCLMSSSATSKWPL